jgi:hypothetical protein
MASGSRIVDRIPWLPIEEEYMPVTRHERFTAQTPVIPKAFSYRIPSAARRSRAGVRAYVLP